MTDAEMRGRLLAHFHALRHNNGGWVPTSEIILAPEPVELRVVGGVCQQLADIGLIQWKPLQGSNGIAAGMAKITGQGVSVVESGRSADIDIRFPSTNETARALGLPETTAEISRALGGPAMSFETPPNSAAEHPAPPAAEKRSTPLIDSVTIFGVRINASEARRRGGQLLRRGMTWLQGRADRAP
jgi:hypothetical protein